MSEDYEKSTPEAEIGQQDDADVEAHKVKPAEEFAATEEGPDVEAHRFNPKVKP